MSALRVVAFGGGVDSTAMLIGLHQRGIKVDLILFADTGGERAETLEHVETFSKWLVERGMPPILTVKKVRKNGEVLTLEQNCLEQNMLPSIAYGFKSCSQKYKIQPQDKFVNNWQTAIDFWQTGQKVTKLIGYDASEERRAKIFDDEKYQYEYPLIEWGWDREQCLEAIDSVGVSRPSKSSCFFCPSMKKREILALPDDLKARAVAMEEGAELTTIKGLGRDFAWKELIQFDKAQLHLFPESLIDVACGCYDGGEA